MTSVLEPAGSAVSPILAVTRSTALQQESRLPGRLTQPAPNSHSNKMADAGEATGHLPLGPAHSICARAELDSTPTAEALPLTSLGAANQECVRESPCVSHSCGLPRSGRRQRVRPFLTAKQPPSGCCCQASPAWQENSWNQREQRFENLFLGTKRRMVAECLAREAWPSDDCKPEGPDKSGGLGKA